MKLLFIPFLIFCLSPQHFQQDSLDTLLFQLLQTSPAEISTHSSIFRDLSKAVEQSLKSKADQKHQFVPQFLVGNFHHNHDWNYLAQELEKITQSQVQRNIHEFPRDEHTFLGGTYFSGIHPLSEGGTVVWSDRDRLAFFSHGVDAEAIKKFSQESMYLCFSIPTPKNNSHIDTKIGLLENLKLLLIDPNYYSDNQEIMDQIALKIGYQIVTTDPADIFLSPANMIQFPNYKPIVIEAPNTLSRIAYQLQQPIEELKNQLLLIPNHFQMAMFIHGIRCMSNTQWPFWNDPQFFDWDDLMKSCFLKSLLNSQSKFDALQFNWNQDFIALWTNEILLRWVLKNIDKEDLKIFYLKQIQANFRRLNDPISSQRIQSNLNHQPMTYFIDYSEYFKPKLFPIQKIKSAA